MPGEAAQAADCVLAVVAEQAEDEGLWFIAQTAAEAYLQQELRRLHAAIEEGRAPMAEDHRQDADVREQPYCEAQVGGMECGRPVERWAHQCEKHDPEGAARRAARNHG